MLISQRRKVHASPDAWTSVKVGDKQKLYRLHHFLFLSGGKTYNIEVQEGHAGEFLAHADNTSDPHEAIKSVSGTSLEGCLRDLIAQIENKAKP